MNTNKKITLFDFLMDRGLLRDKLIRIDTIDHKGYIFQEYINSMREKVFDKGSVFFNNFDFLKLVFEQKGSITSSHDHQIIFTLDVTNKWWEEAREQMGNGK